MKRQKKKPAAKPPELPESGREVFRHGGCEILRLESRVPKGADAAAKHAAALTAVLCRFVKETLANEAAEALESAVAAGCGYRFSPYVCRVNAEKTQKGAKTLLSVTFEVRAGTALLHQAAQESKWDTPPTAQQAAAKR